MVRCRTAELARERIGRLVFADALALMDREALPDVVTRRNFVTTEVATGPSPDDAANRLLADLDEPTPAWALDRYTLHPIPAMEALAHFARLWHEIWRTTLLWCRPHPNTP